MCGGANGHNLKSKKCWSTYLEKPALNFNSSWTVLSRSERHIEELRSEIQRLVSLTKGRTFSQFCENTGQDHLKIAVTLPDLGVLNSIIKDIASNLRDALDHAVFSSVVGLKGGIPRRTAFPFSSDELSLTRELKSRRLSDISLCLHPVFLALKPYKRNDSLLFGLNNLRNQTTHRRLVSSIQVQAVS